MNKQDHCVNDLFFFKSSANALVSLQRAHGKRVPHIQRKLRTRQNNTLDPAVQQHWSGPVSTGRRISHHIHPQHRQKAQSGGVLHLGTINGKTGTLKGGKTKNGGISDNNVSATIFKLYQYKMICTESQSDKVSAIVKFT